MLTEEEIMTKFLEPIYGDLQAGLIRATPFLSQKSDFDMNNFPEFELVRI